MTTSEGGDMNFNDSILVLADLGQLKAYRVAEVLGTDRHEVSQVGHKQRRGTQKTSVALDLITDIDYLMSHRKTRELVSDQAGRFGTSTGEPHNVRTEHNKQTMKAISEDICSLIEKESPASWYLAFPKETHKALAGMLNERVKKNLNKVVPCDLTKTAKNKLLEHFV
jgi:hypothetical protein